MLVVRGTTGFRFAAGFRLVTGFRAGFGFAFFDAEDFEAAVFFYKPYPGNEIADQLGAGRYDFPCTLEGWADFDYVGSAGPWVSPEKYARVERFVTGDSIRMQAFPDIAIPVAELFPA